MITFIIPTIGRPTLKTALDSIQNQTNGDWRAIVIFDGIPPNITIDDPKIKVLQSDKKGTGTNAAANVRNYGMQFVETEWIAFLDDDDTIAHDYIETFKQEVTQYPYVDVIIFRMYRPEMQPDILPPLHADDFHINEVGISFAIKTSIFKNGHLFSPSGVEDFLYLSTLRDNNYCMMISPYVKYYVHGTDASTIITQLGNRAIINKKEGFANMQNDRLWILPFLLLLLLGVSILFIKKLDKYRIYFGVIVLICALIFVVKR